VICRFGADVLQTIRSVATRVIVAITLAAVMLPSPALTREGSPRLVRVLSAREVRVSIDGHEVTMHPGQRSGRWTLMSILPAATLPQSPPRAILEDFSDVTGHLPAIDRRGVQLDFPKSAESTSTDPTRHFLGHTLAEVMDSPNDLLCDALLARGQDPRYDDVAAALPPIRKMQTYAFLGTPENRDKVPAEYGGRTSNFNRARVPAAVGRHDS
jgi:hypothetical protein